MFPGVSPSYRGRLAPSPTGWLHLGHGRTFWIAYQRAVNAGGTLVLRNDDLDLTRVRPEYVTGFLEDLRWLGLVWTEGPDVGGPWGPYSQSERRPLYAEAWRRLQESGRIYPCRCSRRDIAQAIRAPHAADDEPIYPGSCRPKPGALPNLSVGSVTWRFRVPDGAAVEFPDTRLGPQRFVAGSDFGDFVVWRPDGFPSYQLACVVDDAAMGITEVVRGADLRLSTARQILLYEALGWIPPAFHHCPLMLDEDGIRLAKRHDSLSLRTLRARNLSAAELREPWTMRGSPSGLG